MPAQQNYTRGGGETDNNLFACIPLILLMMCVLDVGQIIILEGHLEEARKKVKKLEGKWVWQASTIAMGVSLQYVPYVRVPTGSKSLGPILISYQLVLGESS